MISSRVGAVGRALAGAAACTLAFWVFWFEYFGGFRLDVGNVELPTSRYFVLSATLIALGLPAAACLTRAGIAWLSEQRWAALRDAWLGYSDRRTIVFAALLGALVPLAIRSAVTASAPLTDDEASYRFQAELLASFRLWVDSPPWKLFFDNGFLVNDGKMFSQYFLGWPFLLAFGQKLGVPFVVNPLLSGATAVAVFLVARQWWGGGWGRVAVVVYVVSPFLMTAAATMMSHTAAIFALAWMLYGIERVSVGKGRGASALVAFLFCLAFFTRPSVALGLGLPLLVLWARRAWQQGRGHRLGHALAFSCVALPMAGLFLLANAALTGSPWTTGYHAMAAYGRVNAYRFASFSPEDIRSDSFWFFFSNRSVGLALARQVVALLRLNLDAFGWPMSLGLAFLARSRQSRWLLAAAAFFLVVHLSVPDSGVDSFGPVHYAELMLPLVFLTTDGLRTVTRWSARANVPALAPSLLISLVCVCGVMFLPARWTTLSRLAADINAPRDLAERQLTGDSVVFVIRPFAPPCRSAPARHFVFFRPNNSPDLSDRILWVNHVSVARDREFMRFFPGREGFILAVAKRTCEHHLIPLEEASAQTFPAPVEELPGDFETPEP